MVEQEDAFLNAITEKAWHAPRHNKVNPAEFSEAYQKILAWFFAYPNTEFGLNELADELKISKTTANKVVLKFVKEGFLRKKVLGKIWRISCDKHHVYNVTSKIAYNLRLVYESGILEETLYKIKSPRVIVLFGSYRKGDDTEKSDIDIGVEVLGDSKTEVMVLGVLPWLGYRKNVKVNLLKFSRNNINTNLFANIANGIILYGFLEVKP